MNWHLSVLKPCVQRLIKLQIGPSAFGHDNESSEVIEDAKSALFNDILPQLNKMLTKNFLILGNEPTIADIVIYNELSTALLLNTASTKGFRRHYPNIETWLNNMGDVTEIDALSDQLADIVDKYF